MTFADNGNNTGSLAVSASAAAGVYNLTFTAANGIGPSATQSFTLTVNAATVIATWNSGVSGTWKNNSTAWWTGGTAPGCSASGGDQATLNGAAGTTINLNDDSPRLARVTFDSASESYEHRARDRQRRRRGRHGGPPA